MDIAYDEEDGDFVFTRGAKRAKTATTTVAPIAEVALPLTAPVAPPMATRKPREKAKAISSVVMEAPSTTTDATKKTAKGRKMDFGTPKSDTTSLTTVKRGARKSTRLSGEDSRNGVNGKHVVDADTSVDGIDMIGASNEASGLEPPSNTSTTIALPFSDTPVINRNKEMRKKGAGGARRSSLGMRGRRASSLIDNGHSAIPHKEVDMKEFYKHIEADLPEPRRMKQLLTWVGERALGEKPAHGDPDSGALLAGELDSSHPRRS